MTKEQIESYTGMLHCLSCGYDVPNKGIYYKAIHPDYSIKRCKVCLWIYNHQDKINNVKSFTYEEVIKFLHFLFYQNTGKLNDIATILERSLDDIIKLYEELRVGNKEAKIEVKCTCCNNVKLIVPSVYNAYQNNYCSYECYWKDKTNTIPKGENSIYYNRIDTTCTNCGKKIKVIPSHYNITNRFNDNHNFCSRQCYWEYRSKYYIEEKSTNYQRVFTEEQKHKMMAGFFKHINEKENLNTSIQLKINDILDNLNIKYIREKTFDYYAVDNYLYDNNGIIEVMGDYWHTSPLIYNENKRKINEVQSKQLHRDKIKYSYIINHYNINILYLWENDIKKNPDKCIALIYEYVNNDCILPNYHSFNWVFENGELKLSPNLIIPYQDMKIDEYRSLIQKKVS